MMAMGVNRIMHNVALLRALFVLANGVGPFATLFLQRRYGLEPAEVATGVAWVVACFLLGNLIGGPLIGRISARGLLILSSLVSMLTLASSLLLDQKLASIGMVLVSMVSVGLAWPLFSVLTAQAASPDDQVVSFGYLHLATNAAGVMLFLVGGVVLSWRSEYFIGFGVVVSTCCLLASCLMRLPSPVPKDQAQAAPDNSGRAIPLGVVAAGGVFFFVSLLDAQREYQFPLWLEALQLGDAAWLFSMAGILNGVLVLLLTKPLIAWTARLPPMSNLALASLCYGVGFGGYALVSSLPMVFALVAIWTLGEILSVTYIGVVIAQKAPARWQAVLFSWVPVLQAGARISCIGLAVPLVTGLGFSLAWAVVGIAGLFFGIPCLLREYGLHRRRLAS